MTKDLNLLRLLVVLNEEKQTITAARKLHVSQPTISVMLRKLREQFNDPLFVRDKNKLEPTARCKQILHDLPTMLDRLDALYLDDVSWDISALSENVTLIFSPPLMSTLAVPIVTKLTQLAPNVTVDCYQWGFDSIRDIESKPMCWGLSYLPMDTNKNILQRDIGNDEFMMVMRKDHSLTDYSLSNVLSYPICINLIYGETGTSRSENILRQLNLTKTVNVRTSDVMVMLSIVSESDYIGIVSKHMVSHLSDNYRLVPLPNEIPEEAQYREISLFSHQRNRHDPLTDWLYNEAMRLIR